MVAIKSSNYDARAKDGTPPPQLQNEGSILDARANRTDDEKR